MRLIVGLGNPGKEYANTRHNIGFMVLDNYLKNKDNYKFKTKFNGCYLETEISGEKVIFLKPQKYMNLSGEVVKSFVKFYKIDLGNLLIISDDLDMPCGKIRLRNKGRSGGHNGLKDIETNLGTDQYKRLKIGVGNNKNIDTKDYVLGHFTKEEMSNIDVALEMTNQLLEDFINLDFELLMSKYN